MGGDEDLHSPKKKGKIVNLNSSFKVKKKKINLTPKKQVKKQGKIINLNGKKKNGLTVRKEKVVKPVVVPLKKIQLKKKPGHTTKVVLSGFNFGNGSLKTKGNSRKLIVKPQENKKSNITKAKQVKPQENKKFNITKAKQVTKGFDGQPIGSLTIRGSNAGRKIISIKPKKKKVVKLRKN